MVRTQVNYLEQLPTILHEVIEIRTLSIVEEQFLNDMWGYVNQATENTFISTTDLQGILRFENMLGIVARGTDTLETRRLRVLARFQEQAPYTNRVLINILNTLLGVGNYMYTRDVANKTVEVLVELAVIRQIDILIETLERILPSDMTFTVTQRYNTYNYLSQFTYGYLSNYTYEQVREEPL